MNQKIVDYIRKASSAGRTREEIAAKLRSIGISETDINDSMSFAYPGDLEHPHGNIHVVGPKSLVRLVDEIDYSPGFVEKYLMFFTDPAEMIRLQANKASTASALFYLTLASIICSAVLPAMMLLSGAPVFVVALMLSTSVVAYPIISIILSFVIALVELILLKVLGGDCKFQKLHYLVSVLFLPANLFISAVAQPAILVLFTSLAVEFQTPLLGYAGIAVGYLPYLYSYYILTLILRHAGGLSTFKAVLCWLIPSAALVAAAALFLSAFMAMTSLNPLNPAAGVTISGFEKLPPSSLSFFGAGEPDKAAFSLVFPGDEGSMDSSTLTIVKNGVNCRATGLKMDGVDLSPEEGAAGGSGFGGLMPEGTFIEQDLGEKPVIRLRKTMTYQISGEASGPGCGGAKGEEYSYQVSVKMDKGGAVSEDSGTISGRYLSNAAKLEFEAGYGVGGKTIRYSLTGL
jgi:hypothetical protein